MVMGKGTVPKAFRAMQVKKSPRKMVRFCALPVRCGKDSKKKKNGRIEKCGCSQFQYISSQFRVWFGTDEKSVWLRRLQIGGREYSPKC